MTHNINVGRTGKKQGNVWVYARVREEVRGGPRCIRDVHFGFELNQACEISSRERNKFYRKYKIRREADILSGEHEQDINTSKVSRKKTEIRHAVVL